MIYLKLTSRLKLWKYIYELRSKDPGCSEQDIYYTLNIKKFAIWGKF